MAQIPKGRLVEGPYQLCRDCAMYFSVTVTPFKHGHFLVSMLDFWAVDVLFIMAI